MEKIRAAVFGTGDYYNDKKAFFRNDVEIIAFLDNDSKKQGTLIDGITVYAPERIKQLEFDYVCLMSMYHLAMKQQLLEYGVPEEKIILYYDAGKLMRSDFDQYSKIDPHNSQRKKILLFTWNLGYFGGNIALYDMAVVLQELGYEIYVISSRYGDLERDYQARGISVIIEHYISGQNKEFIRFVSLMDIVIVNTAWYAFIMDDLCRHVKKTVLWWIHDSRYVGCYKFNEGIRIGNHSNLRIYAVGMVAETDFIKAFSVDAEVNQLLYGIEDVYHKEHAAAIGSKPILNRDKIRIAVIGSIEWLKGQDLLIEAFLMLSAKERDQIDLKIIGSGNNDFAVSIRQQTARLPQISCIPAMPHDQLMKQYEDIDVVISVSRSDSMPIVITEGMMQAKTCIVPDNVGTARYIEDGINGLIFGQENVLELSEKLRWLLHHRDELRFIGQKARRVYETYFSKEVFAANIRNVMERM